MLKYLLPATAVAMTISAVAFAAAENVVTQKGRLFSVASMTVKKGEPITFLNDDTVPHNIMSSTPGEEFNLGSQAPGTSVPVTFDHAGLVDVICAIHPRMKLKVNVTASRTWCGGFEAPLILAARSERNFNSKATLGP
jgi:plastocyanin